MNASHQASTFDPASIRAVSFDLDDTFWDCAPVIEKAEDTAHQWMEQHAPRVMQSHTRESLFAHRMDVYDKHPHLRRDVTVLRTLAYRQILTEHDYPEAMAADAFRVFYEARSEVVLYAGVLELLAGLKERYKLAAITNGNADLDAIGIACYFDSIQHASLDNAPKPERQMFDQCCSSLGVSAGQALHVGDNPHTDVGGANSAGLQSVWFNQHRDVWPQDLTAPHVEVHGISDLQNLLLN